MCNGNVTTMIHMSLVNMAKKKEIQENQKEHSFVYKYILYLRDLLG